MKRLLLKTIKRLVILIIAFNMSFSSFSQTEGTTQANPVTDHSQLTTAITNSTSGVIWISPALTGSLSTPLSITESTTSKNITFRSSVPGQLVVITVSSSVRHIDVSASSDVVLTFDDVQLKGRRTGTGDASNIGGGIYHHPSGKTSKLTVRKAGITSDPIIYRCYVGSSSPSQSSGGYGGGIFSTASLTVSSGIISENGAYNRGGGIACAGSGTGGNLIIEGGAIINNTTIGGTSTYGGGVYTNCPMSISGASIDNNGYTEDASNNITVNTIMGGGIYFDNSNTTSYVLTISNGASINGNMASGGSNTGGGGIYTTGRIVMTGGQINGNESRGWMTNGGGIFMASTAQLDISGGEISYNKVVLTNDGTGNTNGGNAIYSLSTNNGTTNNYVPSIKISGTAKLNWNSSTANVPGGAISNFKTGDILMTGGQINNNTTRHLGGGIHNANISNGSLGGMVTITGGEIKNNTAGQFGGALSFGTGFGSTTCLTLSNCTISGNRIQTLSYGGGAGIYLNTGNAVITNCIIDDNRTYCANNGRGAGIYINLGATLDLTDCKITNNICESRESSTPDGGGIYIGNDANTLTLTNCNIDNNKSISSGGGIYTTGSIVMNGGTINGNESVKQSGGGVYCSKSMTISNGTVANNNAVYRGGGIHIIGNLILSPTDGNNVLIANNYTTSTTSVSNGGGGIYVYGASSLLTLNPTGTGKVRINNNGYDGDGIVTTKQGGGILNVGTISIPSTCTGTVEISGNKSLENGGGVSNLRDNPYSAYSLMKVEPGNGSYIHISDNTTENMGGGIYCGSTTDSSNSFSAYDALWLQPANGKVVISGNTAAYGGGVCMYSKNYSASTFRSCYTKLILQPMGTGSVEISNNGYTTDSGVKTIHTIHGGGLYAVGTVTIPAETTGSIKIEGNMSSKLGGGLYYSPATTTTLAMPSTMSITDNQAGDDTSENASAKGGGIYVDNGGTYAAGGTVTLTLASVPVLRNTATGNGGGIFMGSGSKLNLNGTTEFKNNIAGENGGGICVLSVSALPNIKAQVNATFASNSASIPVTAISDAEINTHQNNILISPKIFSIDGFDYTYNNYDIGYDYPVLTVIYKANGGMGDDIVVAVNKGNNHEVYSCGFTPPEDRAFIGWNTESNGTGTSYNPAETLQNIQDHIVLYAQYEAPSSGYTIRGTVFPFVYNEGYPEFDEQFPITASLYPEGTSLEDIVYGNVVPSYAALSVLYQKEPCVPEAPLKPGDMGWSNNAGLAVDWSSLNRVSPKEPDNTPVGCSTLPEKPIGVFTFTGVVPGTYLMLLERPGFLLRLARISADADDKYIGHRELLAGDFNRDLVTEYSDLSLFNQKMGLNWGEEGYDPKYDINGDSAIDESDLSLLNYYMGASIEMYVETMTLLGE